MKRFLGVILCLVLIIFCVGCAKNDIPTVSIPTDDELNELIGDYSEASVSSEESTDSSLSTEESSQSAESQSSSVSSSASSSGTLKPNIGNDLPEAATEGTPEVSEDGHSITTIVSPFLVSDDVIAEGKKNGNPPNPRPTELVCTVSVSCQTAINSGVNTKSGFTHLPSDGWILEAQEVSYSEGETVFDVLARTLQNEGIQMEYNGMGGLQYIKGIDNLYEFDGGRWSGWMYCVNGWYPNFGCGQYTIDPGDIIEWNYTCDLGEDLGQKWLGN